MARSGTFDTKRANEARALFDEGYSCRAIAGKLKVAPSTISRWATDAGVKFDRSQASMAIRAHTVDLAEARLELAQKMMVAAGDMLSKLDGPYKVFNFGGKDNTYEEHTLDEPPVEVVRNAVTTAAIAFDKATKFLEIADSGASGEKSLLSELGKALGVSSPDTSV